MYPGTHWVIYSLGQVPSYPICPYLFHLDVYISGDTLFLKDYLKLKEITMTSLAKTLSSLRMEDTSGRLLQFLWPNRTFETYLQEHGKLFNVVNSTTILLIDSYN